ncbi:hypothetical protein XENOCAPTIV_018562 [Xenoophorus captivus]|uniref:Uncharacterized protein n=1 Tax=Xenoophorus captivus TaxID=1517983 RepID=A0ABV0RHZ4_9TELE
MTKPKAEKGKKQEKVPEEADGQHVPELAKQATTTSGTELGCEPDVGSSVILSAISSMNKTRTDRFNDLEASLASTQALLLNLGARIKVVEDASSDHERCLSHVEEKLSKMQAQALRMKVIDLEAHSRRQNIKIIGLPEKI